MWYVFKIDINIDDERARVRISNKRNETSYQYE